MPDLKNKFEVFSAFQAEDVARSRGPHPFGRSGKGDFCVLRVFCVKSTGPRAREREYARRRMDFRSLFLRILGCGLEHAAESQPNSFPNFYGDRPVPIGQMWSDDRFPLNRADISVALCEAEVDR